MIIQIAGVRNKEELDIIINAGATHVGFPLRLPVNKEDTSEEEAKNIIKHIPKSIHKVLITYLDNSKKIVELSNYLGTDIVQIHGSISIEELKKIKLISPNLQIVKSLVVKNNNFNELTMTVKDLEEYIDFFITDTFDPATGASGATGKIHDWNISKSIVDMTNKPVILAGGLTPENVKQAIETVKPAGVDVHTGVENSLGEKDTSLVNKFVKETREAFKCIL